VIWFGLKLGLKLIANARIGVAFLIARKFTDGNVFLRSSRTMSVELALDICPAEKYRHGAGG
jgi:hypothetical protein